MGAVLALILLLARSASAQSLAPVPVAIGPAQVTTAQKVCVVYGVQDGQWHRLVIPDNDAQIALSGGPCAPGPGEMTAYIPVASYVALDVPGLAATISAVLPPPVVVTPVIVIPLIKP